MWEIFSPRRWGVRWRGKRTALERTVSAQCTGGNGEARSSKSTESNVTDIAVSGSLNPRNALKFERGIMTEKHLWSILDRPSSCIDEFLRVRKQHIFSSLGYDSRRRETYLQKHFAEYPVGLISENGAEDHGHPVVARLDVYCFLFPIMDCHNLTSFRHTLGR